MYFVGIKSKDFDSRKENDVKGATVKGRKHKSNNHKHSGKPADKPKRDKLIPEEQKIQTPEASKQMLITAYTCCFCSEIFSCQEDMDKHEKTHTVKMSCQLCPEVFVKAEDIFFHLNKFHSENFCFWCNLFKDDSAEMKEHKTGCPPEGESKRKCHFCSTVCSLGNQFEDHVINCHGLKDQWCSHCGKCFSSLLALHDHQKEHKSSRENRCEECRKDFGTAQDLIDHVIKEHISAGTDTKVSSAAVEGSSVGNINRQQENSQDENDETKCRNMSTDTDSKKDQSSVESDDEKCSDDDNDDYDDGDDDDDDYIKEEEDSDSDFTETTNTTRISNRNKSTNTAKNSRKRLLSSKFFKNSKQSTKRRHRVVKEKVNLSITCRLCNLTFANRYTELRHLMESHKDNFCLWCDVTFENDTELEAHNRICTEDSQLTRRKCHVCPKKLLNKERFESHFTVVHGQEHRCEQCSSTFASSYLLLRHKRNHGPDEEHPCPKCAKVFNRKKNMEKHLREVHRVKRPKIVKEVFPCECHVCQSGFHSRTELAEHIKVSHMDEINEKIVDNPRFTINFHENYFLCKKCGKNFPNEDEQAIHLASHLGVLNKDTSFVCDVCGDIFMKKSLFNAHRARHSSTKLFPCTKCDKKFHVRSALHSHLQTHRTHKDFVCDICGSAFKSKPSLRMHTKRHNMDRCHVCKYCNQTFRCYDGLKYHWVVYHPEEVKKRKLTVFPCSHCEKVLATKTQLDRHMAKHGVNKIHSCDICFNRYCTVAQLNAHIKNTHSRQDNIFCHACDLYFHIPSKMLRHMKTHKHNENCSKRGIDRGLFYEMLAKIEKDMVDSVELTQYRAAKSSTKYRALYKSIGREVADPEADAKNELTGLLPSGEPTETVTLDLSNVQYISQLPKEVLQEVEISDHNLKPNTEVFVVYDQGTGSDDVRNLGLDAQAVETLQSILSLSNQQ